VLDCYSREEYSEWRSGECRRTLEPGRLCCGCRDARNIGRDVKPREGLARATSRKRARKSAGDYNDWRSEWEIEEPTALLLERRIRQDRVRD